MKLKIWHKMIIGITIPSLIAVLGGILTYGYMNDIKSRQGSMRTADGLKESVLEIRRHERNFLHYRDTEHQKRLLSAINTLKQSVNSISPNTAEKIARRGFPLLSKTREQYAALTGRLHDNFLKETEVIEKVRREGDRLETLVASRKQAKELSTDFVLRLRLLEKNYMFYRDKESFSDLDRSLSQIKNLTPFCYSCTPYIESVHELFTVYRTGSSLTESIQAAGDRLERITEEIAESERQRISSFIDHTQNLLLVALILLFSLGPLLVYKTSSYIVRPINRLAEITRKISDGDIALRAPLKEHDETYSLAVSFNSMLDNLQQTQQSLKESLALLNEKQAQLVESEKRASMGFLVAGVAHELNNPLNNISLRAEIVNKEIQKFSDERLNNYVQDIVIQSERAHNIINNLLDFARARKSAEMERQDIVRIVNDSLNLVASQLRVTNIKLNKDIPDGSFFVNGNRSKLEQILISIITNAIQAMKDAGTLTVSVGPDDKNKNVLVKISDTGKGIPESDIRNIFEPFFTTKPPGEGTGLGLAVSKTLVTEHKGEILVDSRVGAGTTFMMKLPLIIGS
ncbi:MAG: HAMP domain-containing protein [Nitrospiraceae bacterium]|nr:MAG: HAMP domain-containing protein [Nitrospiraceae bacterium]